MSTKKTKVNKTYRNTITVSVDPDSKWRSELVFALEARGQLSALGKPVAKPGTIRGFRILSRFVDEGEFYDEVEGSVSYVTQYLTTAHHPCSALAAGISSDRCAVVSHRYSLDAADTSVRNQETHDVYTGGVLTSRTTTTGVDWDEFCAAFHDQRGWINQLIDEHGIPDAFALLTQE